MVVLITGCAWKCVPTASSRGMDISEVPGCHLLQQMSSQWGSQNVPEELVSYKFTAVFLVVKKAI